MTENNSTNFEIIGSAVEIDHFMRDVSADRELVVLSAERAALDHGIFDEEPLGHVDMIVLLLGMASSTTAGLAKDAIEAKVRSYLQRRTHLKLKRDTGGEPTDHPEQG